MKNFSFPASSRIDSWISVAFGVALSVACIVFAAVSKDWGLALAGLGFAAFTPSRYFAPMPLFQSLGYSSIHSYLAMPRWAQVPILFG